MNGRLRFFLIAFSGVLFLGLGTVLFAYSGMSASVAQKQRGWNVEGDIVIAIMEDDVITSEKVIYDGKDGYCPRFSPDGRKVAFSTNRELKICNIDGSDLKEYPASGWEVSWLRSGVIWIHGGRWSSSATMNKYDAETGEHLGSTRLPNACQQFYVSANGEVGAGTGHDLGVGYCDVDGDNFGRWNEFLGGCSSGPTPEGDYILQNTWPHKVFNVYKIPERRQVASMDINRASSVGLGSRFIWNHQLMAQHCNVCVLPVGCCNIDQLDANQYPCFYDIDEKKLIWMTKTKPGGNLTTHPYDFYKGIPVATATTPRISKLADIPVGITTVGGKYSFDIRLNGKYHLEIINLQGATVRRFTGKGRSTLMWTPTAFGVYSMRLVTENRTVATQLIMVR